MASETLAIKEEYLEEFIEILEIGMEKYEFEISERLKYNLQKWIESEKDYLKRLNDE